MTGDFSWLSGIFSNIWGIAFVALLLGGSIFVHELGHFLAARWRGLKVDRFSIGFGPKIFGWTGKDGVEYRVSWLPLGGYVALPQLADMSEIEGDPSAAPRDLPPITYLDKMITVTAGVVFNLLFAGVLSVLLWQLGTPSTEAADTQIVGYVYHTMDEVTEGAPARELPAHRSPGAPAPDISPSPAFAAGIQPGDRILAVDGSPISHFRDLPAAVALGSGRDAQNRPRVSLTYDRDGTTRTVDVFPALVSTNSRSGDVIRQIGLLPAQKMLVREIEPNSPALLAGLRPDDEITAINGQKIFSREQMNDLMDAAPGRQLTFTLLRNGQKVDVPLQPARIPRTTPLATITVQDTAPADGNAAKLEILPIYPRDLQGADPSDAATPAQKLLVWNVDNRGGVFGNVRSGDFLLKVNGKAVNSLQQVVDALKGTPAGQAPNLMLDSESASATVPLALPPVFAAAITPPEMITRIGVALDPGEITEHVAPPQQFANAFGQIFGMLGALFNPHSNIGVQHLTGPIGISRILYKFSVADVRLALWFAFIINVNLAILNLMPIPVLDGGHILFFTIARLRRRELPPGLIATAQGICLVLIMSLVLYVVVNDSLRWRGESDRDNEALRNSYYYLDPEEMKFPAPPAPSPPPAPAPAKQ